MGSLSEMAPQKAISTLQVAADLAVALKALASNPDIEQMARDAYALPEAEIAKAKQARDDIAKNQAAVADLEATMKQMDQYQAQLNAQEKANKEEKARLAEVQTSLDKRKKDLDEVTAKQSDIAGQLKLAQAANDEKSIGLGLKETQLKEREKALDKREDEMNEKAAKLHEFTKGF